MMSSESLQNLTDPSLRNKMPLLEGTVASTGLSKPQNTPGFLGKQTLQYNGAYFTYDPRAKDGAGFSPPWSVSKTSLLDGRSPVSHLYSMEGQSHIIYRKDSSSSEEGHSSSLRHAPVQQGFMLYTKSPEISSPTATTSKQKTGGENLPSPSENSVYLAIPKPVYGHNPCCNELGCMIGRRYSTEHGSPRIPNAVYEHDWTQTDAHYTERPQRKAQDTVLQQRGLQLESSAEPLKRMTVEAYSPGRARPVIEPSFSSYPCTPTRSLFGSLSEHSQPPQTSPRGYPGLYPSHPTYEHMTSEVYQDRSLMSKYGQLAQHPVFYYPQANGEVENRTQCKDSGNKQREDGPVIHKHIISNPREQYIVPQPLHAEIPLLSPEMLPSHPFMHGFDYPCYAVPRLHFKANQIGSPLKRQHASPTFHPSRINVSPSSQHVDHPMASAASLHKDKLNTSRHVDQLYGSSAFLHVGQTSPVRRVSQTSPSSIQIDRFFSPFTSLHIDPTPVLPPAGLSMDRVLDYSSREAQRPCSKPPKSLPVSPATWLPQSPNHSSDRVRTDGPSSANVRKIIHYPAGATGSKHNDSVSSSETSPHKRCLKRSISHSSQHIKIKEEDEDLYKVELTKKLQKVEKENIHVGNQMDSPPMPVIDRVFSLAPYQTYLQASGVLFPGRLPQRAIESEQHEVKPKIDIKEKRPDRDQQQSVVRQGSKEVCPETPRENTAVEDFETKKIKVEKVDPSDINHSVQAHIGQNDCRKVTIKKEREECGLSDAGPALLKQKCEPDELERKPSLTDKNETSEECKPAQLTAQMNSSPQGDTHVLHKHTNVLQPKSSSPLQPSESKIGFKNIPPHCLKLSKYKIIIPDGKHSSPAPPPEMPPAPPPAELIKLKLQMPVRKHFFELHHSLCKLVSKSVLASVEQELKDWLSQLEMTEPAPPSSKGQKVSCLLGVKAREVWLNEEMKSALHKVLERLREYTMQERCPFPHVMRTGAVFLPMLVVKELLFPMVQGSFIDQVLQEHKVELRPTTLSEEKILIQLHKRACSSRLRRLMSLKHLPDIYTDAVNLLYYTCVCKQLGLDGDRDCREQDGGSEASSSMQAPVFPDIAASPPSPSESHPQRYMKNQETPPQWSRNRTKHRVKSSSRRLFLDNSLSDAEDAGDIEKIVVGGDPDTFRKEDGGAHEPQSIGDSGTDHMVAQEDSSLVQESTENSWTCPLTPDQLCLSPRDTEESSAPWSVSQSSGPATAQVRSKNRSGMILKLRRMLGEGIKRKRARYQAVSESQADDVEGASSERDLHRRTHRWKRTGGFSHHALRPLSSSSKRKARSLLKIKYCPYLSACHSAEHRRRWVLRSAVQTARRAMRFYYPDLVGKRIRHLYEEDDKSEVWYRGEVLRVHEAHKDPLKTIFEVRYDSEPEWKYYLELMMDYKKGWLKIED
ncbi:uncharacterized protein C15orf39 homolog [Acanthochromis polyacanthus]|uniref:uncharacterized protein C15orf39 homolog n=1 Tax=Acanthochromis polyacanthus TaxID=80966 RepID=UPI002234062B|nr:uncharacterized protein C15orf39 homolog [Acanthochromis polyacanthus]